MNFKQETVEEFANNHTSQFDLIVISDVMHHVPWSLHASLLENAKKVLKSGGHFILKDWKKSQTLIHFAVYFADRYITGDQVKYKTLGEFKELVFKVFGNNFIKQRVFIKL